MIKHPTPRELEEQADMLLLRNGFDKNGKKIPKKKRQLLFTPPKELKKFEIPAVG